MNIRQHIESFFKRLALLLYTNPIKTLIVMLSISGSLIVQLPEIVVDSTAKAMFREDDPNMVAYNDFLDQFGRTGAIVLAIRPPEIFNRHFLMTLKALHQDLEKNVPYVRSVNSLINARKTTGNGEELIIEKLFEGWPENTADLPTAKAYALTNPYYKNFILSEDGKLTAIVIDVRANAVKIENDDPASDLSDDFSEGFESDSFMVMGETEDQPRLTAKDSKKIVKAVHNVVQKYQSDDFKVFISGWPVLSDAFNKAILSDMKLCLVLGSVIALSFIIMLFRRVSGVVLPTIIVELSVLTTLGIMAFCEAPITEITMVIPAFLVAVGVADSIHVLTIFYRRYEQNKNKADAISFAFGHTGVPILLTSLTTIAGLLSFSFAELISIADMGIYSATGVTLALIYTIFLMPPLIALTPLDSKKSQKGTQRFRNAPILDRILQFFTDFSTTHYKSILFFSALIFILSGVFICTLRFSHNFLTYFPDDMVIKKDVKVIDKELKGISTLEIIIDTGLENGVQDPDILNKIEIFSETIKQYNTPEIYTGKVFSVTDIVKECHQALNTNDSLYYTIPQNRKIVAELFLLFETSSSEDLSQWVDSRFSKTRISVKVPAVDAIIYETFMQDARLLLDDIFGKDTKITITGGVALGARTIPAALRSMVESYIIAFCVITLLMIFLVGNLKTGLLSMIPNLLPIALIMGLMGISGVRLSMATLMIGSIAIGLVVDDTMHFMYHFQKNYTVSSDVYYSIQHTLFNSGRAMLITSLILSAGFFILLLASLTPMIKFGIFTGLTIVLALIADFTVAPALMTLVRGKK